MENRSVLNENRQSEFCEVSTSEMRGETLLRAEIKKQRYIYYRCTFGRGKCDLPYFREEDLSHRLSGNP